MTCHPIKGGDVAWYSMAWDTAKSSWRIPYSHITPCHYHSIIHLQISAEQCYVSSMWHQTRYAMWCHVTQLQSVIWYCIWKGWSRIRVHRCHKTKHDIIMQCESIQYDYIHCYVHRCHCEKEYGMYIITHDECKTHIAIQCRAATDAMRLACICIHTSIHVHLHKYLHAWMHVGMASLHIW